MSMGLSMLAATVLGLLLAVGILDAAPYQELQPRAGHVPVYIREGETPLSEIHPGLAEAFNEPSDGSDSDTFLESTDDLNSSNSNDQLMSEELVDTPPELPEEPASIIIDNSSQEANKKIEETKEPNANVAEAAKEAIKELVSVFETEMLEKLGLSGNAEQQKSDAQAAENKRDQIKIENQKTEDNESKSSLEKLSDDVLTVEAFQAKDFNKESMRDDEIDIPEEVPSDQ